MRSVSSQRRRFRARGESSITTDDPDVNCAAVAADAMVVIELGAADAHGHVEIGGCGNDCCEVMAPKLAETTE